MGDRLSKEKSFNPEILERKIQISLHTLNQLLQNEFFTIDSKLKELQTQCKTNNYDIKIEVFQIIK